MTEMQNLEITDPAIPGCLSFDGPDSRGSTMHNKELGKWGEDTAVKYLKLMGHEIVVRNWTCNAGEVDIVTRQDDAIVFVEVKTRSNSDNGIPEEAVTPEKRRKYERIAISFLQDYDVCNLSIRFDVIGIMVIGKDKAVIKHHVNAWGAA